MSNQTGWCVCPSVHAPGTAYVIDDTRQKIAFCQTMEDAERIVALEAAKNELQDGYQTLLDDAVDMRNKYTALQASHEELVKALKEIQNNGANYCICTIIAKDALANEAKLAPTRTGGSGCER